MATKTRAIPRSTRDRTQPAKRRQTPAPASTTARSKRHRATNEQLTLAAMANAKAEPAARITPANIARVRGFLRGRKPTDYLGISPRTLALLASGAKSRGELEADASRKLINIGARLDPNTYYGRKLAGMLWAIERGV
jgi:hypothetical protein